MPGSHLNRGHSFAVDLERVQWRAVTGAVENDDTIICLVGSVGESKTPDF